MSLKKIAFSSVMAASMLQPVAMFAADYDLGSLSDSRNMKSLREYVDSQRNISIFQKGGSLLIAGDVRFDMNYVQEKRGGINLNNSGLSIHGVDYREYPSLSYDAKASLSLKYSAQKSFADILLKASHNTGWDSENYTVSSGAIPFDYDSYKPTKSGFKLEKAVFGTDLINNESQSLSVELGRQRLYDLFDSRITFMQKFEGVALKYKNVFEGVARLHATLGGIVISDRAHHYGFAGELGLGQIADTPFGLKYAHYKISKNGNYSDGSPADSTTTRSSYKYYDKAYNYSVSHLLAYYDTSLDYMVSAPLKLYAAYAYNHDAVARTEFGSKKKPHAAYGGFTVGDVKAPGSGYLDVIYQYVQAESVPELDNCGAYYGMNQTHIPNVVTPTAGYTNFKGFAINGGYLATKEILVSAKFVALDEVDAGFSNSTVGGTLGYEATTSALDFKKFEAEVAYIF